MKPIVAYSNTIISTHSLLKNEESRKNAKSNGTPGQQAYSETALIKPDVALPDLQGKEICLSSSFPPIDWTEDVMATILGHEMVRGTAKQGDKGAWAPSCAELPHQPQHAKSRVFLHEKK